MCSKTSCYTPNSKKSFKNLFPMRKIHNKKSWISRTMEWLKIPQKIQADFKKNLIGVNVDYLQYTCYNISEPLLNLYNYLWFSWEIDMDNSNVEYNFNLNLSLVHNDTKMGHAYQVTFLTPWFAPIPIFSVEVYNPNRVKTLGTQGKIVFYGAFFVFNEILQEEAPEVIRYANAIELGTLVQSQKNERPVYKRTRVDVAVDVWVSVSQKWHSDYISPHKNSNHTPRTFNNRKDLGGWQSISYIPRLWQCLWIRVYNKILDIIRKKKKWWYPNYGTDENPIVTRIEVIYSWDSAMDSLDNLLNYTKFRILWDSETLLKRYIRPKSEYSPLSAFKYFQKYAKNHGKKMHELLHDVCSMYAREEEYKNENFSFSIETA